MAQAPDSLPSSPAVLLAAILDVTETQIVPLLRESGKAGNAPFGAAILDKANLRVAAVAANDFQTSPLLHGETNCIRQFFGLPARDRPDPDKCVFLATHEPCALCLSAIAWTEFRHVYFLFTYAEVEAQLGISKDVEILKEVFRVPAPSDTRESLDKRPLYNAKNKLFEVKSAAALVDHVENDEERGRLKEKLERVKSLWEGLRHGGPWQEL